MARKKFSRLSVLLEARDKMSGVFKNAANSSQKLSSKINTLNDKINKSRSTIASNVVQQRLLSDGYRRVAESVGQTTDKVNVFTRAFRKMPESFKLVTYYLEGYTKALGNLLFKNKLVTSTSAILSTTLKYTGVAIWSISRAATAAVAKLWELSRIGKALGTLVSPLVKAGQKTKELAQNTLSAVKATSLYKITANTVNSLKNSIQQTARVQMTYLKGIPHIIRGTRAWVNYKYAIDSSKRSIQSAYLSFNLWKNSSRTVERLGQAFNKISSPVRSLGKSILGLVWNTNKLSSNFGKTGSKGRATFSQLTSSNARLNRELEKMNAQLAKANSRMGSMKASLSGMVSMGALFGTAYAAQAAYGTAKNMTTETVGYAMEQQYSSASVGILAGEENGPKFYKQIQDYAAQTAFSTEEWARNMRGAISKSSTIEDLKVYQTAMEQLATLDPAQGLEGAALAIREFNSGDSMSLVERFELPRGAINEIKNMKDPVEQIRLLTEIVGKETGYTVENIEKMKELPLMQWEKAKNIWKTMKGYMGEGALEVIAPLIKKFNQMWDSGQFNGYIQTVSDKLKGFAQGIVNIVQGGRGSLDKIKEKLAPLGELFNNISDTIKQAWPSVVTIFSNVVQIIMNIVSVINSYWPTVNSLLQKAVEHVAKFSTWIVDNWSWIAPIVAGVLGAFAGFRIFTTIAAVAMRLWAVITRVIAVVKAAGGIFKFLFLVLRMNPIGIVVTLIMGLVSWFITAYKTSDTFREKVQAAWTWIKDVGAAAIEVGKNAIEAMSDAISSAVDWIGKMWEKFTGFVDTVKNTKINWSGILPGGKSFIEIGGKSEKPDGRHSGGLNNVPHDGYKAILHKGERVLTRDENKQYSRGGAGGVIISGNQFIVREEADIDKIANVLYSKIQDARTARGRA